MQLQKEQLWTNVTLIHYPGCTITTSNRNFSSNREATTDVELTDVGITNITMTAPEMEIKPFHVDPRLNELKHELASELKDPDHWLDTEWKLSKVDDYRRHHDDRTHVHRYNHLHLFLEDEKDSSRRQQTP